jgi:hypothetical protein
MTAVQLRSFLDADCTAEDWQDGLFGVEIRNWAVGARRLLDLPRPGCSCFLSRPPVSPYHRTASGHHRTVQGHPHLTQLRPRFRTATPHSLRRLPWNTPPSSLPRATPAPAHRQHRSILRADQLSGQPSPSQVSEGAWKLSVGPPYEERRGTANGGFGGGRARIGEDGVRKRVWLSGRAAEERSGPAEDPRNTWS